MSKPLLISWKSCFWNISFMTCMNFSCVNLLSDVYLLANIVCLTCFKSAQMYVFSNYQNKWFLKLKLISQLLIWLCISGHCWFVTGFPRWRLMFWLLETIFRNISLLFDDPDDPKSHKSQRLSQSKTNRILSKKNKQPSQESNFSLV